MYKKYEDLLSVKLVSYTRPGPEFSQLDSNEFGSSIENLISYCARVSNPSNQGNLKTHKKLIKYLLDHKHFSPFEMVNICLEVITTRDIGRQILRHSSIKFQEFSQRYADPTKEFEFCLKEPRLQDVANRQNSISVRDASIAAIWEEIQTSTIDKALANYNRAINIGIAKEVARAILPEGNTLSRMYMNGSIRSWIHYVEARGLDSGTQKEHMLVANECAKVISELFLVRVSPLQQMDLIV